MVLRCLLGQLFMQNIFQQNDLIIVSSDSEKYLKIVEKWGAVPHKRPKSLSGDKVFTEPVMEDVLKNFDTKLNDKVFYFSLQALEI